MANKSKNGFFSHPNNVLLAIIIFFALALATTGKNIQSFARYAQVSVYDANIDVADCNRAAGWIAPKNNSTAKVCFDLRNSSGDTVFGSGAASIRCIDANQSSSDVKNAGFGNGSNRYDFAMPSLSSGHYSLIVHYLIDGSEVGGDNRSFDCSGSSQNTPQGVEPPQVTQPPQNIGATNPPQPTLCTSASWKGGTVSATNVNQGDPLTVTCDYGVLDTDQIGAYFGNQQCSWKGNSCGHDCGWNGTAAVFSCSTSNLTKGSVYQAKCILNTGGNKNICNSSENFVSQVSNPQTATTPSNTGTTGTTTPQTTTPVNTTPTQPTITPPTDTGTIDPRIVQSSCGNVQGYAKAGTKIKFFLDEGFYLGNATAGADNLFNFNFTKYPLKHKIKAYEDCNTDSNPNFCRREIYNKTTNANIFDCGDISIAENPKIKISRVEVVRAGNIDQQAAQYMLCRGAYDMYAVYYQVSPEVQADWDSGKIYEIALMADYEDTRYWTDGTARQIKSNDHSQTIGRSFGTFYIDYCDNQTSLNPSTFKPKLYVAAKYDVYKKMSGEIPNIVSAPFDTKNIVVDQSGIDLKVSTLSTGNMLMFKSNSPIINIYRSYTEDHADKEKITSGTEWRNWVQPSVGWVRYDDFAADKTKTKTYYQVEILPLVDYVQTKTSLWTTDASSNTQGYVGTTESTPSNNTIDPGVAAAYDSYVSSSSSDVAEIASAIFQFLGQSNSNIAADTPATHENIHEFVRRAAEDGLIDVNNQQEAENIMVAYADNGGMGGAGAAGGSGSSGGSSMDAAVKDLVTNNPFVINGKGGGSSTISTWGKYLGSTAVAIGDKIDQVKRRATEFISTVGSTVNSAICAAGNTVLGCLSSPANASELTNSTPQLNNSGDGTPQTELEATSGGIGSLFASMVALNPSRQASLTDFIGAIIRLLMLLAGIIAVIFIILGGYRYITSAGNQENSKAAVKSITNAVIGLIIVIAAWLIINLVLDAVSGKYTSVKPAETNTQAEETSGE